ncbi:MAG: hypothetical protein ACK5PZ_02050, partial [Pirellula sp.]
MNTILPMGLRLRIAATCVVFATACVFGNPMSVHSQEAFQKDDIDAAVTKAIGYLLSQQKPNGSITDRGHDNAMTALAIMAMASVGHQPSDSSP